MDHKVRCETKSSSISMYSVMPQHIYTFNPAPPRCEAFAAAGGWGGLLQHTLIPAVCSWDSSSFSNGWLARQS
jgi:hypothetical protein